MGREGSLKRTVETRARQRGAWLVKLNPSNGNGLPDLLLVYLGVPLAVELKQPGERARRLQEWRLEEFRRAGGRAIVASSWAEVEEVLDSIASEVEASLPAGRQRPPARSSA